MGRAQPNLLLLFKKLLDLPVMISILFSSVKAPPGFLLDTPWVLLTDNASAPAACSSTQFLRPALGLACHGPSREMADTESEETDPVLIWLKPFNN